MPHDDIVNEPTIGQEIYTVACAFIAGKQPSSFQETRLIFMILVLGRLD
jgi:hypothetical protein